MFHSFDYNVSWLITVAITEKRLTSFYEPLWTPGLSVCSDVCLTQLFLLPSRRRITLIAHTPKCRDISKRYGVGDPFCLPAERQCARCGSCKSSIASASWITSAHVAQGSRAHVPGTRASSLFRRHVFAAASGLTPTDSTIIASRRDTGDEDILL